MDGRVMDQRMVGRTQTALTSPHPHPSPTSTSECPQHLPLLTSRNPFTPCLPPHCTHLSISLRISSCAMLLSRE